MKNLLFPMIAILALALVPGCSDDEGGSTSGGDGSGSGSGDGSGSGSGSGMNCSTQRECINGACECSTPGREGTSCCDDCDASDANHCDTVCRVCS
jgi:hypothetical protein